MTIKLNSQRKTQTAYLDIFQSLLRTVLHCSSVVFRKSSALYCRYLSIKGLSLYKFYIKIMVNKYQTLDNDLHAEVFKDEVY